MTETKFEQWCLVELFGHSKIAGYCTEQNIGGNNMLRVDVPETNQSPAFTKFYGNGAVYAISPIDEGTCRAYAEALGVKPIEVWGIREYMEKERLALPVQNQVPDLEDYLPM